MGRAPCCDKDGLRKGPWTSEEDQKLIDYIEKHGHGNWRTLPKNAGLARCGKSCRLRWTNYLRPDIKRGRFSSEEEETIIKLHSILGNKWSAIAARLPGRTDNEIKNFWNTHIRKKLHKMGIDPVTHAPRADFLDLIISSFLSPSLYNPTQLEMPRLLGLGPLINGELLKIATTLLLTSQCQNSSDILSKLQSLRQQHEQQNSSTTQPMHAQLTSFETLENIPAQYQLPPIMAASDAQLLYDVPSQIAQACPSEFPTNLWEDNNALQERISGSLIPPTAMSNEDLEDLDSSILKLISEPLELLFVNGQKYYNELESSNSSSPATLNSSSLPSTNIASGSSEGLDHEKESYCSDILNFEVPDLLDVSDIVYM